ncbi:MAG TPA: nuclear transport factor 2 family protein [Candidatus Tumulicola sp.]|jgi:ketosteroid isomerase-like protein
MKAAHLRLAGALLALTLLPAIASAQAKAVPPAAIVKLANAVVNVGNTGDVSSLSGIFTGDAVVVDENAPFVWRGANAGVNWWNQLVGMMKRAHMGNLHVGSVRVGEYRQSPNDAYLVEAMVITGSEAGKPFAESGTMTFTFHKTNGRWLISTEVWSTKP